MSPSCTSQSTSCARPTEGTVARVEAPVQALREIVKRYGTPTYAYEVPRIRAQVAKLRATLPRAVEVLYSLKANASLGVSQVLAGLGLGADVASAGELVTAVAAGFSPERIFLTGPDKSPAVLAELHRLPEVVLSLDSVSELRLVASLDRPRRVLLRLRPDFCSYATCSAGPDSRFGLTFEDLPRCREYLAAPGVKVVGFHVFSGSQVLAAEGVAQHLRGGLDLALRAAKALGIRPEIIDIGGGFGIPYGPEDRELDLAAVGAELQSLVERAAPARLVVELGRYLVAQAGWYLTTVLGEQTHRGRKAVVVDGGSHQRTDMCGVGLRQRAVPSVALTGRTGPLVPTDVLGCLSLPADVLVEAGLLPSLEAGDVLAFPNAGAYGLHAAPCLFHAHPAPAEVAFDGDRLHLLRARQPIRSLLETQSRLPSE
jgi:diaminopimelate decarboxylase